MSDLSFVRAARKKYDEAIATIEGALLRRAAEVRCPLGRRERRADAHAVSGAFLREMGDPQRAYPSVHVAGTSGKGSVAWGIAHRLREAGLRVGLHMSPYLQVATEKVWIDGRHLDAAGFARIVRRIAPVAARYRTAECPATVHGMASAAVAFEAFRRARVDVAVVEACCGGRWDITNHLDTRVAVITSVGDDHADVLGPTVRDIAWHKAGVLRRGAAGITGASGMPLRIIRAQAESLGVDLRVVPTRGRDVRTSNPDHVDAAVEAFLTSVGRAPPNSPPVHAVQTHPPLAGRIETVQRRPTVVLDVAHNPQKARALLRSLPVDWPAPVLVFGCIAGKTPAGLVRVLARRFRHVVLTEPRAFGKPAVPAPALLARFGRRFDLAWAEPDPHEATLRAMRMAGPRGTVVVTGSAFLVGAVRGLWYPDDRVLVERTSYPEALGCIRDSGGRGRPGMFHLVAPRPTLGPRASRPPGDARPSGTRGSDS